MESVSTSAQSVVYLLEPDEPSRALIKRYCQTVDLCVRTFQAANQLLEQVTRASIGCVVSALLLPGLHGLELQKTLLDRDVDLPFIFIADDPDVPAVREAMRNGALDFFVKPFSPQLLLRRIQEGLSLQAQCLDYNRRRDTARQRLERLTAKEHQVVNLLIEGMGNKQVAYTLNLSVKAVEARRRRIRAKLEIDHFVEMVVLVLDSRLPAYHATHPTRTSLSTAS